MLAAGAMTPHCGDCPSGEQPNGQHHLLRHVLSPQQCSDALRHFGTNDSKAAARMVNRMSQRELRDMFEKVYTVHTNSNNNTWLRRKLLEAVGASRRFYNAANKTGRPKGRRPPAAAAASGHTSSAGSHRGAAAAAAAAAKHAAPCAAAVGPMAGVVHHQQQQAQHTVCAASLHHQVAPSGPHLPAGSPRALSQRMRAGRAHTGSGTFDAFHYHSVQQQQYQQFQQQSASEEETCSDGSDAPRALAPQHRTHSDDSGCASPTSAFAAQQQQQMLLGGSAVYSLGSNTSLHSSQFAGPAAGASGHPLPPPVALGMPASGFAAQQHLPVAAATAGAAGAFAPAPFQQPQQLPPRAPQQAVQAAAAAEPPTQQQQLPHLGSFSTLSALMAGAPAACTGSAAAMLADLSSMPSLPAAPGADIALGSLWGPGGGAGGGSGSLGMESGSGGMVLSPGMVLAGPKVELEAGSGEQWLTWEDWQLPSLF